MFHSHREDSDKMRYLPGSPGMPREEGADFPEMAWSAWIGYFI